MLASDDEVLEIADALREAGVAVPRVVDLREGARKLEAHGRGGQVRRIVVDGDATDCDLVVVSGGRQPAYSLLAQAGARVEYDDSLGVFVPTDLPDGVEAVGSVTGEGIERVEPQRPYEGRGKCFVCICEDVTTKDVKRAIGEGFDSIELSKRYTTVTMGPCQGKLCQLPSIHLYARELQATSRRSAPRPRVRRGRRSSWACSRDGISSRRAAPRSTSGTRSWVRR